MNYTKRQAVLLFGSKVEMAKALNTTPQAIYVLKDKLTRKKQDEVIGAGIRSGLIRVQEVE